MSSKLCRNIIRSSMLLVYAFSAFALRGQTSMVKLEAKENPEQFVRNIEKAIREGKKDQINDTVLLQFVEAYANLGDFKQAGFWADSLSNKYLKDSVQNSFEVKMAKVIASVLKTNLDFEGSLDLYLKSLNYYQKKHNLKHIADSYIDLAEYHRSAYNHALGLTYIEKARNALKDTLYPPRVYARLLNRQAALINESKEDKAKVIALSKEALQIAEELQDPDMIATICNEIGSVVSNETAEPYYQRAIENWRITGNEYAICHTKINLARVYNNTGRNKQGIDLVNDVMSQAERNSWFMLQWWAHEYLAATYAKIGEWDKSSFHVTKALHCAAQHEESRHQRDLRIAMARSEAGLVQSELKAQQAAFDKVKAELKNERLQRNFILTMAIVVSFALILVVFLYRRNQRANKDLSNQKKITELMNNELKETLQQRETLIQEVHHRVKNNLQIISSMLNMQVNNEKDEHTINSIQNAQQRVHSIALIHERLYRHESLVRISFNEYLNELVAYLKTMVDEEKIHLKFKIEAVDVSFKINTAIPLGLIINELVTNSIKYAFEGRKNGEIYIELKFADDKNYLLTIKDNGNGFDPDTTKEKPDRGIGTTLVNLLVRQLRASYDLQSAKGTTHYIKFPFN